MGSLWFFCRLFRVFCEEVFTAEAQRVHRVKFRISNFEFRIFFAPRP